MNFTYKFPAVKGKQANQEYYTTMVPLRLLGKMFSNDIDVVQPEYRAQRKVNEKRIPEITKYILDNRDSYVFSALSASIDGEFEFHSTDIAEEMGILEVDMKAIFLINDGQHRKAAIEAAMNEDESLFDESISIVFFRDKGLQRSQQMFTDLNKHAVKTSNSLSTLYDSRDELAVATKNVIDKVPFLTKYTDKERDILGKNSSKLFTLNNIYKANTRIVHGKKCNENDTKFLVEYWSNIANNLSEWNELMEKEITKKDLREDYIITLAVTLNAFGKLGGYYYENGNQISKKQLEMLRKIDWLRSNCKNWLYRVIRENGKVMSNEQAITLTCSKIKQLIGEPLTKEEIYKEEQLKKGIR